MSKVTSGMHKTIKVSLKKGAKCGGTLAYAGGTFQVGHTDSMNTTTSHTITQAGAVLTTAANLKRVELGD